MKRTILFIGLVTAVTLAILVAAAPYQKALAQQPSGAVLWGSSWHWRTITANGSLPAFITYQQDGSINGSDASMFGGTANNPYRYSSFAGVWERIGPNEFAGTSLYLRFDPATNKLIGIARARSQFAFAQDFDHIAGTFRLDVLPCPSPATCPDPLADTADWQPYNGPPLPNEFSFEATRIKRVPIAE